MADFTLLDSFPAPVRVFIRLAQAARIEYREGRCTSTEGKALASLHGDVAAFQALPEMASHRIPLSSGAWWLKLGIVGKLRREGDTLTAVIDYTRQTGPRTRFQAAQRAARDRDFAAFMRRAIQPVDAA